MEAIRELRAASSSTSASTDAPFIPLLDWEMPGMSGRDICRAIRSNPSGPYRYLIVITAREGEEGIAEAMASGADDFVCKPFGIPEVVARILHRASVAGSLTV